MRTTASLSPEMAVVGKIICKGIIKKQPTGLAYATDGVRIDPRWIMPSTQP
jgi:hypothetical protein